eukprot:COSAG05_NODE_20487_length_279_cov_0.572222_1_plen_71_part_01
MHSVHKCVHGLGGRAPYSRTERQELLKASRDADTASVKLWRLRYSLKPIDLNLDKIPLFQHPERWWLQMFL